jgi:hypothetical protein
LLSFVSCFLWSSGQNIILYFIRGDWTVKQGYHKGGGHHGRTHDATKMAPIVHKYPKSKTAKWKGKWNVPQHGAIRVVVGDTSKRLAKQRHKKKSREYHKQQCREGMA